MNIISLINYSNLHQFVCKEEIKKEFSQEINPGQSYEEFSDKKNNEDDKIESESQRKFNSSLTKNEIDLTSMRYRIHRAKYPFPIKTLGMLNHVMKSKNRGRKSKLIDDLELSSKGSKTVQKTVVKKESPFKFQKNLFKYRSRSAPQLKRYNRSEFQKRVCFKMSP